MGHICDAASAIASIVALSRAKCVSVPDKSRTEAYRHGLQAAVLLSPERRGNCLSGMLNRVKGVADAYSIEDGIAR